MMKIASNYRRAVALAGLCGILDPPGVSANQEMLQLVRDAQRAHLDRYLHGELEATFRSGQRGPNEFHELAAVRLAWSEEKVWCGARLWGPLPKDIDPTTKTDHIEEWIIDPRKSIVFHPLLKNVYVRPRAGRELPLFVELTPRGSWFGPLGLGYTWLELLTDGGQAPGKSLVANVRPDGLLEVRRSDPAVGYEAMMVFALDLDANLLHYDIKSPQAGYRAEGECVWERLGEGKVQLKRATHLFTQSVGGDDYVVYRELQVDRFDSERTFNDVRFEMASLDLPSSTMIRDEVAGHVRRLGDRPQHIMTEGFDVLIDEMKSKGFAARRPKG